MARKSTSFIIGQVMKETGLSKRRIDRCIDSGWIDTPDRDKKSDYRVFTLVMIRELALYSNIVSLPIKLRHEEICGPLLDHIPREKLKNALANGREELLALVIKHIDDIRPPTD